MDSAQESKTDKRTKEYKVINEKPQTTAFEILKQTGIPVKEAVFHRTVKSWNGEPETAFYATGGKPSRTATMWFTPHGLACEQAKGKKILIPLANIVYAIPL